MLINELQVKGRSPWRLQCQLLTVTLLSAALPCKSCVCRGHNKLILSAWHNPLRSLYVICFCSRRWLLLLMFVSCKLFHPNKKLDQMQRHSSQQQQQQRQPKQQQQHSEEKTKQVNGEESNATVTVTGAATPGEYSFLHSADEQRTQTKWHMHMHTRTYTNTKTHYHRRSCILCIRMPALLLVCFIFFVKQHPDNFLPSKTVKKLKCCLTTLPLDKFEQAHRDTERCYSHFHIAVYIMPICLRLFVSKASWHI